jgi:hypothetical protein
MLTAQTLTSLSQVFDDETLAAAILSSLPSAYNTSKMILSSSTALTTEYVTSQVILEEQRRVSESGVGATVFFAKAARKAKGGKKDRSGDKEKDRKHCTHCNIRGHDVKGKLKRSGASRKLRGHPHLLPLLPNLSKGCSRRLDLDRRRRACLWRARYCSSSA